METARWWVLTEPLIGTSWEDSSVDDVKAGSLDETLQLLGLRAVMFPRLFAHGVLELVC